VEMVGDRDPKGGVTPEEKHERSGDASVTELTLPCAFVRKRGPPDPRFLARIIRTQAHTHARTHARTQARTHARTHART